MSFKERLEGYKKYGRFCVGIIVIYIAFMAIITIIDVKWNSICSFFGKFFKKNNNKKDNDFDV